MRPKVKGNNKIVDPSWDGECNFLTDKGCKFNFDDRPLGCKSLIPSPDMICHESNYDKREAALAWLPYNSLIEESLKMAEFRVGNLNF